MKTFEEADLSSASRIFAVANTPLFLLRKLREDATVQEIAHSFSGDEILSALRSALDRNPQAPEDFVRPYVYLMALAILPDSRYLKQTGHLTGADKWDWFDYSRRVLLQTFVPTGNQILDAGRASYSSVTRTDAAVEEAPPIDLRRRA